VLMVPRQFPFAFQWRRSHISCFVRCTGWVSSSTRVRLVVELLACHGTLIHTGPLDAQGVGQSAQSSRSFGHSLQIAGCRSRAIVCMLSVMKDVMGFNTKNARGLLQKSVSPTFAETS
jgi:hypothetical protein